MPPFAKQSASFCIALLVLAWLATTAMAAQKQVIYGFGREFPPFSYERDGQPAGFEVELLRAVLANTDVKLSARPMDWEKVRLELSAGNVHVTSGMAKTEQRELLYDFSTLPTATIKIRAFTQNHSRVASLTQLRGKRIAVQDASLYQRILEDYGGLNIKLYKTDVQGLKALHAGEVEAFGGADKTAWYYIRKLELDGLSPVGSPLSMQNLYFAVNKDQQELLRMINNGMRTVMENGVYDQLYRKWFVPDLTDEEQAVLVEAAKNAVINAYAPYSQVPLGAAVMGQSGAVYTGCSIENGVPAFSVAPLQVALYNAISGGEIDIKAAVAVRPDGRLVSPNAEELRLLYEFGREVLVMLEPEPGRRVTRTLADLLPSPGGRITLEK